MTDMSAADTGLLATLENWVRSRPEILVLVRYSRAAGAKDFEFFSSFPALAERIRRLPPETNIIAFREPQLPLRKVVDNPFIASCLEAIPDGTEFVVAELAPSKAGGRFRWTAGESHDELRDALADFRGVKVAVGPYPPWLSDSDEVVSAVAPNGDGSVTTGIY